MTTPRPKLPPVLLGPGSGRKVAEHIELFGKSEQLPDPRDEAVGLLREIDAAFYCDLGQNIASCIGRIRPLLARIDK